MTSGDTLRDLRIKLGLTQQQVADRAGWKNRAMVSQLEKRSEVPPGSESRYVKALSIEPDKTPG
jgi:transcriptional regulator with XRE-family HTH domain